MKRARFEQRLLRIFAEAGYQPSQLLDITLEEMVEILGTTVPNIRTVLAVQNKALDEAYGDHKKWWVRVFCQRFGSNGKRRKTRAKRKRGKM